MSKKIQTGLGRGLDALLPSSVEFTDDGLRFKLPDGTDNEDLKIIDLKKIIFNPLQPRKDFDKTSLNELKESIVEHGVITPITVRRTVGGYELIAGERRVKASLLAGLEKIPALIKEVDSNVEMLELALIENIQRSNLNPMEISIAYNNLVDDCGLTQEEVSKKVGKDRTTVTNFLRLLKLPQIIQDSLRKQEISMGHARALLAISSVPIMIKAFRKVTEIEMSVRQTEQFARDIESGKIDVDGKAKKQPQKNKTDIDRKIEVIIRENERQLQHKIGSKVKIKSNEKSKGRIEIFFNNLDEYESIIDNILE